VEGRFLLYIVIREGPAVLKLLSGEDQPLLIGRNAFFILNLLLDVLNGVGALDLQSDGLASQCLYKDLHVVCMCMCVGLCKRCGVECSARSCVLLSVQVYVCFMCQRSPIFVTNDPLRCVHIFKISTEGSYADMTAPNGGPESF